jgi:hypothetical protein
MLAPEVLRGIAQASLAGAARGDPPPPDRVSRNPHPTAPRQELESLIKEVNGLAPK